MFGCSNQQKGRKALKESFTSIILKEKNCYTKFIESIIVNDIATDDGRTIKD
jgi:hypothetical protein